MYPITYSSPQRVCRGIALHSLDRGARRRWVVITTPQPVYLREGRDTHCTGGWLGRWAGLEVCEKSRLYRDSNMEIC
jgi:hypothetical protein